MATKKKKIEAVKVRKKRFEKGNYLQLIFAATCCKATIIWFSERLFFLVKQKNFVYFFIAFVMAASSRGLF